MVKASRNRIHSISILIEWSEEEGGWVNNIHCSSQSVVATRNRQEVGVKARGTGKHGQIRRDTTQLPSRLLPTDKLVLKALRDRAPGGEAVTPPVKIRELMEECSISRRQVQICLRRLSEKGMITRITKGVSLGNQEGYQYGILQNGS